MGNKQCTGDVPHMYKGRVGGRWLGVGRGGKGYDSMML